MALLERSASGARSDPLLRAQSFRRSITDGDGGLTLEAPRWSSRRLDTGTSTSPLAKAWRSFLLPFCVLASIVLGMLSLDCSFEIALFTMLHNCTLDLRLKFALRHLCLVLHICGHSSSTAGLEAPRMEC